MSDTENLNEAADSGLLQPRLVRLSIVPVMIGKDEWVTCPSCGFREIRSGGWPGNEYRGGWRCSCDECGQLLTVQEITEVMCEDCAGGGSRWQRIPSTAKYEMQRITEDSGSGKGKWVRCSNCDGKGFISRPNS
jgi:DNA-directed RNA polymerase subunit RPC12/RpoP